MQNKFVNRRLVIGGIILLAGLVYLFRLFFLQVVNTSYKLSADNNSRQRVINYPGRGLITDRHGKVLVYNEAVYDLMVVPRQVSDFDTMDLCRTLEIDRNEFEASMAAANRYSRFKPSPVVRQVPVELYSLFQEKLYRYPGFYFQTLTQRKYPFSTAAHVLGFTGEVNQDDIRSDSYYGLGDYIGKSGLEQQYEGELRGQKGVRYLMVDVYSRVQGSYEDGRYDTLPQPGLNLVSTLEADLQSYGELLMQGKTGSIVAIEPSSGEILALISSPAFDPNELVGRSRSKTYSALLNDSLNPLFNRATMSRYAPGSIFKIVQALVGLEMGVIHENSSFDCNTSLIGCHNHPTAHNVVEAIQYSCNPYFFQVYRRIIQQGQSRNIFVDSELGLQAWQQKVMSFGLGQVLPADLPGIKPGFIPGPEFYDKWYGNNRWAFSTIYSNCNGQGEVETVPIQIANLAAIFANRGYYYLPHLVKSVADNGLAPEEYRIRRSPDVDQRYFDVAVEGMYQVVYGAGGTGSRARVPEVVVCGKTGTVQNVHGEDHSGFFAFAPMDQPKIALAVYVENAGAGGLWSAIICSLMIEKYLKGEIKQLEKERMVLEYKQY